MLYSISGLLTAVVLFGPVLNRLFSTCAEVAKLADALA
jgi:hypothetical protein